MSMIVLLHAFGSSHRAWQPQVAEFGERHRVLAPDLPGHGGTPGPFTIDGAVDAVRELIAAEDEPVHLTAISGSVTVAVLATLAAPDRVASLVLSGGVAHTAGADSVQRLLMSVLPEGVIVSMLKGMYSGNKPEHLDTAVADLRGFGKRNFLTGLRQLARIDLRPRLAEIKVPTLVLCGEKDKANVGPAKEIAAAVPDARLRLIPSAGHIWNLELPELFSRTVGEFVEEAAAR